jgi:integrase
MSSLAVFQPSPDPGLSAELTLSAFFERYVVPLILTAQGSAERNIAQYRESLALWEQFTLSPSLAKVAESGQTFPALFLKGLRARRWRGEPLSQNTIRKHCVHVQAVLDLAGPSSRKLPAAAALIALPPAILKPSVVVGEVEDVFTLDEIERQFAAAECVPQTEYWRALFPFAYNTAFRALTIFAFQPRWIVEDELGCWAKVPSSRAAIKGGRGRKFFLNEHALAAIRPLLAAAKPTDRLLAPPFEKSWFYRVLHAIQIEAGLPAERRFGLHALRKACNTELVALNPLAASWHLGHSLTAGSGSKVNRDHYTHRRAFVEAVRKLPQPAWRSRRQKRLF